jgi:F-type H+-transporting ATPase subunit epsilon
MANEQNTIELQVVTPERHILSEDVESVEMPGKDGYLGVLPGHAPLLTEMGVGILTYRKGSESRSLTVMGGYGEVLPNRVIVLADASERTEQIDRSRAQAALDRAKANVPGPTQPKRIGTRPTRRLRVLRFGWKRRRVGRGRPPLRHANWNTLKPSVH